MFIFQKKKTKNMGFLGWIPGIDKVKGLETGLEIGLIGVAGLGLTAVTGGAAAPIAVELEAAAIGAEVAEVGEVAYTAVATTEAAADAVEAASATNAAVEVTLGEEVGGEATELSSLLNEEDAFMEDVLMEDSDPLLHGDAASHEPAIEAGAEDLQGSSYLGRAKDFINGHVTALATVTGLSVTEIGEIAADQITDQLKSRAKQYTSDRGGEDKTGGEIAEPVEPAGPGQTGGSSDEVSGGGFDPIAPISNITGSIVKTISAALNFTTGEPVKDSDLPDMVIFDVMKRNDQKLHNMKRLFAHDLRFTDVLYVRGTSNMSEWRGNVTGSNDQQLLRQQTQQVLDYLKRVEGIRHIIGHSRGAAIAHDAAHITGKMFCGIDGAMVIARGPVALKARNINKTGGFDRVLDPIGPIERTSDGSESGISEKIHHAELGTYTDEYQKRIQNIRPDRVATGFERGETVRAVSSRGMKRQSTASDKDAEVSRRWEKIRRRAGQRAVSIAKGSTMKRRKK